jgi:myo-inositol-1(or 4)-monophosphatase
MTLAQPLEALSMCAKDVARDAGLLVMRGFRSRPAASEKARRDLVTEYDLGSEQLIRSRLAAATPEIPVVAEEGGGDESADIAWFCDPLDGTTNFVHGHPFWAVSVGLVEGGRPVLGAVVAPALGLEWWGWREGFAFRNSELCRVSDTRVAADALVATGFPPDRSRSPDNNFDAFQRVKQHVRGVRRCGAAAIDCCLVADGTYDAYWERRLHAWDVAAGCAVALSAGARLTALDGGPADLRHGHIVLSNGLIHDEVRTLAAADGTLRI